MKVLRKILVIAIVSLLTWPAVTLIPAGTGTFAEAGDSHGSENIVFRSFISGSGGSNLAVEHVPDITVNPENYDWGDLWVGFSDPLELTIANGGSEILNISGFTISDTENFTIVENGGIDPCGELPITIEAGDSCTCLVKFHPQLEASYSALLSIDCDDPDTPTAEVTLTGTGVANDFPFGDVNYSVNVDSGCSIIPKGGSGTDGLSAFFWLVPALLCFGVGRKRKGGGSTTDRK